MTGMGSVIALAIIAMGFIWQAFRHQQFQWLWSSVLIWIALGVIGKQALPYVLGVTQSSNLYFIPFSIAIGSIFYLMNQVHYQTETKLWVSKPHQTGLLLFALSNLCMHMAWLIQLALIWLDYPQGQLAYALPALLNFYPFSPEIWLIIQSITILIWYIHGIIRKTKHGISVSQLILGILLISVLQLMIWTRLGMHLVAKLF